MSIYEIQPFFFPTTVAFVDDNADFLSNLSLQLNANLAFRLFNSPCDALLMLNGSVAPTPLSHLFSLHQGCEHDQLGHHVINVSLDRVHREVHNEQRFEQISVVVVDYDMPEMNGLDFCRGLKNPYLKKVLLTGEADEELAVKAFNEGVIDRFIRKQHPNAIDQLNRAIYEMQQAYFGQIEKMLSDALAVGTHTFLKDEKFALRFSTIKTELNIVEHYLVCEPDGLLMLDAQGTGYLLMVRSAERYRADYEIAYDQNAPLEILNALRRGIALPYFDRAEDNFNPVYSSKLPTLYPAEEFEGKHWYLYSIIKYPAALNLKYVTAYNEYLEKLDAQSNVKFSNCLQRELH